MHHRWLITGAVAALTPTPQWVYAVEYADVDTAQHAAFPDATKFELVLVASDIKAGIARDAGRFVVDPRVWRVRAGDRDIGWYVVDEVIGKVELITYGVALDTTGAVKSVEILAYRESHGDSIKLASWRGQFVGKRAADPVKLDVDIRNISGSTLSSRHVTEGVHRVLQIYERALAHG